MPSTTAITHRVLPSQKKDVRADLKRLAAAVEGARTLAAGASGPAVEALQRTLKGLNLYSGKPTGQFDAATEQAVRALEAQSGLTADGVVDSAELGAIRKRELFVKDGFETPARIGQKGGGIKEIENKLQKLGFHPGKVDGVFDQQLQKAVEAYRKADKSVPDQGAGIGPRVLKGLRGTVKELEANLKELGGKPGKVDGFFSKKTTASVKAFQKKHDLKVTGIANAQTRGAIEKAADKTTSGGISNATQKFIDVAKAQTGDPYVFGAQGPDKFDCSGLIYYALKQAGVDQPRTTARGYQARYASSKVSRENLKPGDLVFLWYPNTRGIPPGQASHIEIYLGNGKTMGTDNPSEGARVESIDWSAFISGARVPGLNN